PPVPFPRTTGRLRIRRLTSARAWRHAARPRLPHEPGPCRATRSTTEFESRAMYSKPNRIPAVRRTPLAAFAALIAAGLSAPAMAQDDAPVAQQPAPQTLKEVVVTANPLGSDLNEMVAPVSTLGGDALTVRQASTLGETLNSMPGVTSSYFGP